ncbi:hypothetical protein VP01_4134g1 [Puccinia sorghi]|uniref:Uncharacterized protein n=1 Tax=Puccinia sorghi TaxID=27349 RepID=A0A0L6UR38_9BASI|nr:hypothetical protein VP01_4134g1 [Puccinia sorghi]
MPLLLDLSRGAMLTFLLNSHFKAKCWASHKQCLQPDEPGDAELPIKLWWPSNNLLPPSSHFSSNLRKAPSPAASPNSSTPSSTSCNLLSPAFHLMYCSLSLWHHTSWSPSCYVISLCVPPEFQSYFLEVVCVYLLCLSDCHINIAPLEKSQVLNSRSWGIWENNKFICGICIYNSHHLVLQVLIYIFKVNYVTNFLENPMLTVSQSYILIGRTTMGNHPIVCVEYIIPSHQSPLTLHIKDKLLCMFNTAKLKPQFWVEIWWHSPYPFGMRGLDPQTITVSGELCIQNGFSHLHMYIYGMFFDVKIIDLSEITPNFELHAPDIHYKRRKGESNIQLIVCSITRGGRLSCIQWTIYSGGEYVWSKDGMVFYSAGGAEGGESRGKRGEERSMGGEAKTPKSWVEDCLCVAYQTT